MQLHVALLKSINLDAKHKIITIDLWTDLLFDG